MSQEQALVVLNEERRGTIQAARNAFALRRQRFLVSWLGRLGEQWRSCSRPVRAAASRHGLLQSCARSGKILRRSTRRNRVPWQVCRLGSLNNTQRCLTLQSTGPTTAGQLGPVGGTRYIFANRAKPSCRSGPVTSNVGQQKARSASSHSPMNSRPEPSTHFTKNADSGRRLQPRRGWVRLSTVACLALSPGTETQPVRGRCRPGKLRSLRLPRHGAAASHFTAVSSRAPSGTKCTAFLALGQSQTRFKRRAR